MKKIIEYHIIEADSVEILSAAVNRHIGDGWVPYGNMVTIIESDVSRFTGSQLLDTAFAQPMVKYEEDEPKKEIL